MRIFAWTLAAVLTAGCATTHYTPTLRFRLDPAINVTPGAAGSGALGVRTLLAARPYKQAIVFQDPNYVLTISSHDEWSELPGATVSRALTDALTATRRFKDVGDAINLAAPDYVLTGELRRFDVVRADAAWSAVCEVRFELRKGMTREPVWAETLNATEPLAKRDVVAAPEAMSKAVSTIVNEAAAKIAAQP